MVNDTAKSGNQRFVEAKEYLQKRYFLTTDAQIAERLGVNRSYVSELTNKKRNLTPRFVDKIVYSFPEVSKDWLLTGEGSMLLAKEPKGNATMVDPSEINWISVPVVPYRAMAGSTGWYEDVFAEDWEERRTVMAPQGANPSDYVIFTVTGDSMLPNLADGDEILSKHVPFDYYKENRLHIYNHSIWIIATMREGILIKNITAHDVEQRNITCHSYNPMYTDFTINLADVRDIYHAVSLSRKF